MTSHWVTGENASLLTDLYQLSMMEAYRAEGMNEIGSFELFVRRLPDARNYLIACGLEDVLEYFESVHFSKTHIDYLNSLRRFSSDFLDYLAGFRFTGEVWAMPEGTIAFGNEPVLEVVAPLTEAQLAETFVINQFHTATLAASKASRVVTAAQGRTVVDYGLRRMQGTDAGIKAARAFHIAGVDATSNVLAGKMYGIPVSGTMGHSYIQAHETEYDAFRNFVQCAPGTILLVDTYDTIAGIHQVIRLSQELGSRFEIGGIRLDSGDLATLSKEARRLLNEAGLSRVKIFASSGLDEHTISRFNELKAPIDGYGVGTQMAVSADAPYLDFVCKLVEYAGRPRTKRSPGKSLLPGRKQVYRQIENGVAARDVLARRTETLTGTPLLEAVMIGGRRVKPSPPLNQIRDYCREQLRAMPPGLLRLSRETYPVEVSPSLQELAETIAQ